MQYPKISPFSSCDGGIDVCGDNCGFVFVEGCHQITSDLPSQVNLITEGAIAESEGLDGLCYEASRS
jgi:hypothetical protein